MCVQILASCNDHVTSLVLSSHPGRSAVTSAVPTLAIAPGFGVTGTGAAAAALCTAATVPRRQSLHAPPAHRVDPNAVAVAVARFNKIRNGNIRIHTWKVATRAQPFVVERSQQSLCNGASSHTRNRSAVIRNKFEGNANISVITEISRK